MGRMWIVALSAPCWLASGTAIGSEPPPTDPAMPINFLAGEPLDGQTGLTVVTEGLVVELAEETLITPLAGLHVDVEFGDEAVWTQRAGSRVLVAEAACSECATMLFDPARPAEAPSVLPVGDVTPGRDVLWLRQDDGERCSLARLDRRGVEVGRQPLDCAWFIQDEIAAGLVVYDESQDRRFVVDRHTLVKRHDLAGWYAADTVAGVLTLDGDDAALLDPETFAETRRYVAPTDIGSATLRAVSPDGTVAAISYDNPAWPGPRQRTDVWLLDVQSGAWTQVPEMPLAVSLKPLGVHFADDGRLVVAGWFEGTGEAVVVWDGQTTDVSVRPVDIAGIGDLAAFSTAALHS